MTPELAGFSAPFAAPAKLNLMLRVVGRREDGYHLLQTVFRFIDYSDTLRIRVRDDGVVARVNDLADVPPESDLCVRAATALQQSAGVSLGADIHLEKRLPMGGGLGGGSSDAATTLIALNSMWKVGYSRQQLMELGVKLGADVPVFVFGENAFAEGIGESLQALTLPPSWYVVLIPPVAVPTASIFAHPNLKRDSEKVTIQGFSEGPPRNDLQAVACQLYPEVARHLAWLEQDWHDGQDAPRRWAMMTGSGACVFAPFATEGEARQVLQQIPSSMRGFVARGLDRHPLHGFM